MFLPYVFGFFVITVFNSQFHVQAQDQVFECYSWGDPHVQTWHPKIGGQILNKDCYSNGEHVLVKNKYVDYTVHIKNKLTDAANIKFLDPATNEVVCHIHLKDFSLTIGENKCEKHGITWTSSVTGTHTTLSISYPAANFLTTIREQGSCPTACYYNIYVWQPESLVDESTGICGDARAVCTPLAARQTDDLEWVPVRSGSQRQIITNEQAKTICNKHVDAFFIKTGRAPYQRNANLNNTVANVLVGCIDDLILTGQIEMARSGLDVLMIEELTSDATSIDSIYTAVQFGTKAAFFILNDAAKMAEAEVRRIL